MIQRLTRTREELDREFIELDNDYSSLLTTYSREQLVWRPGAGIWSIAECIEHVARVNSRYLRPIKLAIAKGGALSPEHGYVLSPGGWFSAAFLKRIGPTVTVKFKASRKILPLSIEPQQAIQELRRGHVEIRELLAATSQTDFNRIRFKNPFVPILRFTVATGLLIMAAHGRRHLEQAERLSRMDGFPRTKDRGVTLFEKQGLGISHPTN